MSAWRRVAIEKLPRFRQLIEQSENVVALWIDLTAEFECAHREPIDHTTISAVYDFAWWCVGDSHDSHVASATVVGFFEGLPTNQYVRELMPQFMTRDEFLGMVNPFRYSLSSEEHEEFVRDFLARRERIERLPQH